MLGRVSVLDGGFPAWTAEGFPVDTQAASEEEVDAAAAAARSPNASGAYPAKLQVCACKGAAPKAASDLVTEVSVHASLADCQNAAMRF